MPDFSYQLYCSRNFPPLAETLRWWPPPATRTSRATARSTPTRPRSPSSSHNLGANGLRMPTGHFGIDQLENDPDRVLEIAKEVGIETIYCPHIAPDQRPADGAGWHAFGQRLQKASAPYRDAGLGFGWHNHDFEFKKTSDGVVPLTAIFEGGPDLEWEADIAWVIRGGGDPLEWIKTMGNRITAVHVKDIAPAGENKDEDGWADVGHGTVDWKALMAALKAHARPSTT